MRQKTARVFLTLLLLASGSAVAGTVAAPARRPPQTKLPIADCASYCTNTRCDLIQQSYVCTDTDGSLYNMTCGNTAEYEQAGSTCCRESYPCCTYIDSRGYKHKITEVLGATKVCAPQ